MIYLFANNAETSLAFPAGPTDTSVTLLSGTGDLFPSPAAGQGFALTLSDAATGLVTEITLCTTRVGDVCTVQRAQEGTTAKAWAVGSVAENLITAATLRSVQQKAGFLPPYRHAVSGAGPYFTPPYDPTFVVLSLGGTEQPQSAYTYSTDGTTGTLNLTVDPVLYDNILIPGCPSAQ